MHFKIDEIPIVNQGEGGACFRSTKAGRMDIGFTRTAGPADYSHVYRGLPGNVCPCDHYGFVFSGQIRARYADGSEEVIGPGDIYYIPKGHVLIYEEATEHLEINDHEELKMLMETVMKNAQRP